MLGLFFGLIIKKGARGVRWKQLKQSKYFVSDHGQIRRTMQSRIQKPSKSHGYFIVGLSYGGKRYTKRVARLVAEAFIPNPNNYPCINHKDGVKTNNHVSNLEWCTQAYNVRHAWANGLCKPSLGDKNLGKRSSKPVINHKGEIFPSMTDAQRKLGFDRSLISKCVRGIYKQTHGYKWRYYKIKKVRTN